MRRYFYFVLFVLILVGCMQGTTPSSLHVEVGKPAPPIEGTDVDGRPVKLSEFRGKVVVVDFWATWCGPCRKLIPHEKALVKRMQGRPFVLLGVSNDDDLADLRNLVQKEQIAWPNIYDGRGGPITRTWGPDGFPTFYLIDAKGVIRYLDINPNELDKAVDTLVAEAEAGK